MEKNQENKEKVKENKIKNKIMLLPKKIILLIKIVLVIIVMIGMYFLGSKGTNLFKSKASVINRQFENRSQLITQVERITLVKDTKEDRTILKVFHIPFTESRLIFSYDAVVEAGVDFSKIRYESENEKDKILVLNVPHAEIVNASIDVNSKKKWLDQDNLFSRIDFDQIQDAIQELVGEAKEKAKNEGELLQKADENARRLIDDVIRTNDRYKDYTIEYKYIGD